MAILKSTQVALQPVGFGQGVQVVSFSVALTATTPVVADTWQLFTIPANPVSTELLAIYLSVLQIDSTGGLTTSLGDLTSTAHYSATTSTFGVANADIWHNAINAYVANSLPFKYTAANANAAAPVGAFDVVQLKVTHVAGTYVPSLTLSGFAVYLLGQQA